MRSFSVIAAMAASIGFYSYSGDIEVRFSEKKCEGQKVYAKDSEYVMTTEQDEIKVLSYNVENLFDTVHNEGKDDYEFLPSDHKEKEKCEFKGNYKKSCYETNWTDEGFEIKLAQIKRVVDTQGELPDIFAVTEVENVNVVSQLADYLGYPKFLVTSGRDDRIELALLYKEDKIKLKEMKEIVIDFPAELHIKKTRNILAANFVSKKDKTQVLGVYVNHWPSQRSVPATRQTAAKFMRKAIDTYTEKYGEDNYHVLAMGDFNTIDADKPSPFDPILKNPGGLVDVQNYYIRYGFKNDPQNMKQKMPPGTYFYSKDWVWNDLDRIFASRNLFDDKNVEIMPEFFRIIAPSYMLKTTYKTQQDDSKCMHGTSTRYEHNATDAKSAGFSDHFPIAVKIRL